MARKTTIRWLKESEEQDYPAALSYLSVTFKPKVAAVLMHSEICIWQQKGRGLIRALKTPY